MVNHSTDKWTVAITEERRDRRREEKEEGGLVVHIHTEVVYIHTSTSYNSLNYSTPVVYYQLLNYSTTTRASTTPGNNHSILS